MIKTSLQVQLNLTGPVLTRSTAIGQPGVDAPIARTRTKQCYLPFSLVRGKLLESFVELNDATSGKFKYCFDELFGKQSEGTGTEYEPRKTRLFISDFIQTGCSGIKPSLRYRIRMDNNRGAAVRGAIQTIECPFAPGEEVVFTGEITFFAENRDKAEKISSDLEKGLRWITNMGAGRTVGFGRLVSIEVDPKYDDLPSLHTPVITGSPSVFGIDITIKEPFCVARPRVVKNLFESEIILSGAVLRGAFASSLKTLTGLHDNQPISEETLPPEWRQLGKYFNHIRFSHAFPVTAGGKFRPVVPPLSLVKPTGKKNNGAWYDVALCKGPLLIDGFSPEFSIDWKDDSDIRRDFGWFELERELRVRTSIDSKKRRSAKHELFAYESVIPDRCSWASKVNLGGIPDSERSEVHSLLEYIFKHGHLSVGKTKARAAFEVSQEMQAIFPSDASLKNSHWIITLQTPALLCNPASLDETSGKNELFAAYNAAWDEISGKTLKLKYRESNIGSLKYLIPGYFARQSLAGRYLVERFQPGRPYNPFLLTDPGSVFVLEPAGDTAKAQECIWRWLRDGLDLPDWAKNSYGDNWASNPFLPVDGFGEIAVNLQCHDRIPPEELITYVE